MASALTKKVQRGELTSALARELIDAAPAYVTQEFAALDLLDEAVALSLRLGHAVYDCIYLALAEQLRCPLITADARFADRARGAGYTHAEVCWP